MHTPLSFSISTHILTSKEHKHTRMEPNTSKIKPYYSRSKPANAFTPCKKHPKHRQSPGVCSVCLNEKLSQLNNHNSAKARSSSSPSSSYDLSSLSSSNASSYSSPAVFDYRRSSTRAFRNIDSDQDKLKKSRSMAFVFQKGNNVVRKRGLWWKLLFPGRVNISKG